MFILSPFQVFLLLLLPERMHILPVSILPLFFYRMVEPLVYCKDKYDYSVVYLISKEIVQSLDKAEVIMSPVYVTFHLLDANSVFLGLSLNLSPAVNCRHNKNILPCIHSGLWLVWVQEKDSQGYLSSLHVISTPFGRVIPFYFHFQSCLPLEVWIFMCYFVSCPP